MAESLFESGSAPSYMRVQPNLSIDYTPVQNFITTAGTLQEKFMEHQYKFRPDLEEYERLIDSTDALPGDRAFLKAQTTNALQTIHGVATDFGGHWQQLKQTERYQDAIGELNAALVNATAAKKRNEDYMAGYNLHKQAGTLDELAVVDDRYVQGEQGAMTVAELYMNAWDNPQISQGILQPLHIDTNTSTLNDFFTELGSIFSKGGYQGWGDNEQKLSLVNKALPVLLNTNLYTESNYESLNTAVGMFLDSGLSRNAKVGLMRGWDQTGDFNAYVSDKVREYADVFKTSKTTQTGSASQIKGGSGTGSETKADFAWSRFHGLDPAVESELIEVPTFVYDEEGNTKTTTVEGRPAPLPADKLDQFYPPGSPASIFGTVSFANAGDIPIGRTDAIIVSGPTKGGSAWTGTIYDEEMGGYRPVRRAGETATSQRPADLITVAIPVDQIMEQSKDIPLESTGHPPFHVQKHTGDKEWVPLVEAGGIAGLWDTMDAEFKDLEAQFMNDEELSTYIKQVTGKEVALDSGTKWWVGDVTAFWPSSFVYRDKESSTARTNYAANKYNTYVENEAQINEALEGINLQDILIQ